MKLDQQLEIDIVAFWSFAMGASDVMAIKVDTCKESNGQMKLDEQLFQRKLREENNPIPSKMLIT